jgi:hypothetical protein
MATERSRYSDWDRVESLGAVLLRAAAGEARRQAENKDRDWISTDEEVRSGVKQTRESAELTSRS